MRWIPLLGAAVWLALWTVGVGSAWAHANLERSSPASNAVLPQAPRQLQIAFSEQPEPRFSEIVVYDASGQRVETGPLRAPPDQPRQLAVDLSALPDGPYTVSWKTLSAVDGHTATGAYTFAVGVGQTPGAPTVPGAADTEAPPVDWPAALTRWLTYLSTAVLVGTVPFTIGVADRSVRAIPGLGRVLVKSALVATVVALIAGAAGLLVEVGNATGRGPLAAIGPPLLSMLGTRYGLLWAARTALIVVTALLLRLLAGPKPARTPIVALTLVAAGTLLATLGLNSHAAAMQVDPAIALALDWAHLVGMSVWVGGLVQLAACTIVLARAGESGRRQQLGRLVARFSPLATWAVVAIVLSGVYQGLVQVGSLDALTATPYGQTLLWKIALVIPMLGVGLVNTAVFRPRLAAQASLTKRSGKASVQDGQSGERLIRLFRVSLSLEVALGVLVLAATGVLTSQEPAREAYARMPRICDTTQRADDLRVRLSISPATAGFNTIDVTLQNDRGRPAEAQRVTLRLQHLEHDMGENEVTLDPAGDGRWTTQGSFLSMVGRWQVAVLVRRDGRDDARSDFEVPAGDPTLPTTRPAGALSVGSAVVGGIVLLLAAIPLIGRAGTLRRPIVGRAASALIAAGGLYLIWTGVTRDVTPTFALANPIPPTRESLDRGQELYVQNCLACHGPTGRGDGPAGRALKPPPADLRVHVTAHTEGQLYWWIGKGFPGSAMPAFEEQLSEEDRWNVLNYIVQTFGPNGGHP